MIPQHGTLELSRSRLRHNLALLRAALGPATRLCATLKADAYGHGVQPLLPLLHAEGVDWACVYSLPEALDLAARGLAGPPLSLLVLSPVVLPSLADVPHYLLHALPPNVRLNLTDLPSARALSAALAGHPRPRPIHIQLDTGLTRVGAAPQDLLPLARAIAALPGLRLEGVFTHLSHGDVPAHPSLRHQLALFRDATSPLLNEFPDLLLHMQNSGGACHLPPPTPAHRPGHLARVGIALYGLQPSTADPIPGLTPIARLTAPILALHDRPAGVGVGYGHAFTTARPSRLAVVPVGYADGYPRRLSNTPHAVVSLHGRRAPVVGRVSMDQIIVDVTDIPPAAVADPVTVFSWDPADPHALDPLADALGTIGYELATHLGHRLRRVIVD
jgi:alanine racemase